LAAIAARSLSTRVIGVEREYRIDDPAGAVDARTLWPTLSGLGAALDPGDPNARRGSWGGVVTVDGAEAEVVTPPVPLQPGCTHVAGDLAATGTRFLQRMLPPGLALRGYSTHVNVEVDDRIVVGVARLVAGRLALPLMLALDRSDSPGLLVRPRRGRLEIGGEFACGTQLRAAVGLAVGITLLAESALGARRLTRLLPSLPRPEVVPARERYGFYIDRCAFGPDLYLAGRDTVLRTRRGMITGGDALRAAWRAARPRAETVLDCDELEGVDAVVDRSRPIPLEDPEHLDLTGPDPQHAPPRSYAPRRRGPVLVTVESATWWRALLRVDNPRGTCWVTVPGRALDTTLEAIDQGCLDDALTDLAAPGPRRHLFVRA
jgi:hypothetical protein